MGLLRMASPRLACVCTLVAPRLRSERVRVPDRCVPDRARLRSYCVRGLRGDARKLRSERVRGAFGESLARDVRSGSRVPDRAFGPADRKRVPGNN